MPKPVLPILDLYRNAEDPAATLPSWHNMIPENLAAHLAAEHLSAGVASGGYDQEKLQMMIQKVLSNKSGERFQEASDRIKEARSIYRYLWGKRFSFARFSHLKEAAYLLKKVEDLKPGQEILIPVSISALIRLAGHAISMTVKRNQNGTYRLRIFDEGGIRRYLYYKKDAPGYYTWDKDGRRKLQTAFEVDGIMPKSFAKNHFFKKFLQLNRIWNVRSFETYYDRFYQLCLKDLGGKKCEQTKDSRLWSHGQTGGSCVTRSMMAVVRSILNKQEYIAFKKEMKLHSLLSIYRRIKLSSKLKSIKSEKLVTIASESIKKLEHHYKKYEDLPLPQELVQVKKSLKQVKEKAKAKNQKPVVDPIGAVFSTLRQLIRKIAEFFFALKIRLILMDGKRGSGTLFKEAVLPFNKWDRKEAKKYLAEIIKKKDQEVESLAELDARSYNYLRFAEYCLKNKDDRLNTINFRARILTAMGKELSERITKVSGKALSAKETARLKKIQKRFDTFRRKYLAKVVWRYKATHVEVYYPKNPDKEAINNYAREFFAKKTDNPWRKRL